MGRLSLAKQQIDACKAGVDASGNYVPTTLWEVGIPNDSAKQMDRAQWTQVGVGVGAVIKVWGSMLTKFDNPTPSFDISVPVQNGNPITAISGVMKKQRSSEQLTVGSSGFGNPTSKVHLTGNGISNTANETWDFYFTYTLA